MYVFDVEFERIDYAHLKLEINLFCYSLHVVIAVFIWLLQFINIVSSLMIIILLVFLLVGLSGLRDLLILFCLGGLSFNCFFEHLAHF